jgi:tRNA1Val (adenine37-N6)-methyltransferase
MALQKIDHRSSQQFTQRYHQPNDYHFCLDSIIFAEFVSTQLFATLPQFRVLDLCSGCGVIGLELSYWKPEIKDIDFLEIQSLFKPHFELNASNRIAEGFNFRFVNENYECLTDEISRRAQNLGPYDLIVANPPYFFANEGKVSPNPTKNHCRFFLDSGPTELIHAIVAALSPTGAAFVLIKEGGAHGRKFFDDIATWVGPKVRVERVTEIRGTSVIRIKKIIP